ncbi:MAG: TadE/TadG family type IV pilus assembly protein [Phenylobacterium sp.]|uniref:TadE/TadG family type IV pilus assembly protein n=1 Tax=Phenylobacterium sp. TaxID=1871053 RepID=UPI00391CC129
MLRSLIQDRRGVSAVEFALIAPVMIVLYLAMTEVTMGLMANRRADHVASAIGDLVAQVSTTSTDDISDVFTVGEAIMSPFPTGSLNMRLSSVKADAGGTPKVVWSRSQGLALPAYADNTVIDLPDDLVAPGESVIMSETRYTYTSPVGQILPTPLRFNDVYYLRPRRATEVTCSSC